MKKALLPIIALCAWAAPAFADEVYGTTPETAKPFPAAGGWFVPDLATAPAEAYFTITYNGTTPAQWGDTPGDQSLRQIFVYLCDGGQEALQRSEGSNSWVLFPGQEYLVKIVPQAAGFFGFSAPMAFPAAWEGLYKYYPKDITDTRFENRVQAPGTTKWYLYDVPYATQITTNTMLGLPNMDITTVEAIHIQCPGGTNTGSGLMGPYVKAGKNIIGVTVAETAAADVEYVVALNAMVTLNCSNNLLRGQSLTLDSKNTYPDAYYTVDRYFNVPEDGTYTFVNHGAKGTILNVGMVKRTDPENQYKSECDWSGIKSATVGNDDAVVVVENLKAGDIVAVQSDAFGVIGEGIDNMPYLMVTKGATAIKDIADDGNTLDVVVSDGKLSVESVLLAAGAEVAVYDMAARKVASAVAPAGAEHISMKLDIAPGVYVVVVYGKGNSESSKIVVK